MATSSLTRLLSQSAVSARLGFTQSRVRLDAIRNGGSCVVHSLPWKELGEELDGRGLWLRKCGPILMQGALEM